MKSESKIEKVMREGVEIGGEKGRSFYEGGKGVQCFPRVILRRELILDGVDTDSGKEKNQRIEENRRPVADLTDPSRAVELIKEVDDDGRKEDLRRRRDAERQESDLDLN